MSLDKINFVNKVKKDYRGIFIIFFNFIFIYNPTKFKKILTILKNI